MLTRFSLIKLINRHPRSYKSKANFNLFFLSYCFKKGEFREFPECFLKYLIWKISLLSINPKSCIRDILNILTCVDSSTNTKRDRFRKKGKRKNVTCHESFVMCPMSGVRCQVSHVMCHMSCVACPLSPVTNANSQSHKPSPC